MTITTDHDGTTYTYCENTSKTRCCITRGRWGEVIWWGCAGKAIPAEAAPIEVLLFFSLGRLT